MSRTPLKVTLAAMMLMASGCGDSAPSSPQRSGDVAVLEQSDPSVPQIERACAPQPVDDVQTNWDVARTYVLCYDAESGAGPGKLVMLEDSDPDARTVAAQCDPAGVYSLDVNWDIARTYIVCEDLEAPEGDPAGVRKLNEADPSPREIAAACAPDHPAYVATNWDVDRTDDSCQRRP